jgi:signal transduction histidine kinase
MDNSINTYRAPDPRSDTTLTQQKRELAILNAIFQTISDSSGLKETLERSLEVILSYISSSIGWVCLLDEQGGCYSFVGQKGLCTSAEEGGLGPCLAHCVCDRVRKTREVVVIDRLAPGCPLLLLEGGKERLITGHVSVPLTAKSRIVGQLNVAFNNPEKIVKEDVDLLRTIGPQLAVAIENARLWEELQHKERMRTELLKKVVQAQEDERRRISRELHDELGQSMTSLLIGLKLLEKAGLDDESYMVIGNLTGTVSGMLSSIHDMALELRPTSLDDLGLAPALAQYARESQARLGFKIDFEVIGMNGRRLPREVESTLYRIIQESLTNVARHSMASKVSIILRQSENSIIAIVEDNGVGFDTKQAQEKNHRLGLYGMQERASLVGGKLTVESTLGVGTTIYVEVPLEPKAVAL